MLPSVVACNLLLHDVQCCVLPTVITCLVTCKEHCAVLTVGNMLLHDVQETCYMLGYYMLCKVVTCINPC